MATTPSANPVSGPWDISLIVNLCEYNETFYYQIKRKAMDTVLKIPLSLVFGISIAICGLFKRYLI